MRLSALIQRLCALNLLHIELNLRFLSYYIPIHQQFHLNYKVDVHFRLKDLFL